MNTEIIMYASDKAAKFITGISGWVSRDGTFFGDKEDAARYNGCTHRVCTNCGKPTQKYYLICTDCMSEKQQDGYLNLEALTEEEFKQKISKTAATIMYSPELDVYFNEWQELVEYCEEYELELDPIKLKLKWCVPVYLPNVDPDELYIDILPEDKPELPDEIYAIFKELDAKLDLYNENNITSYSPYSKYRVKMIDV